jgi:2-polyprenyl-3-methyl-5-hydroxy-6-metoxy-1,4-benzoquinol methylase
MILNKRYKNDGVAKVELNELQKSYVEKVRNKIESGAYVYENVLCPICAGSTFEKIAEKERYGFEFSLSICIKCGLALTNPRMNQTAYHNFYNDEYRFIYGGEEGPTESFFKDQYLRLGKRIYTFITETVQAKSLKEKFVLEIGCGAGGILKYFQDQGCMIKGIDLGSQFVEYGRNVHGLDLEVTTIDKLQLDRKPDIIIYSHVLEHILDLNAQLKYIQSMMTESTILYIEVPGLKNLHRTYQNDLLLYLQNAHVFHFTKTSLLNLMTLNGFKMIAIDEYVRSVFKKNPTSISSITYKTEYPQIVNYLKSVELQRRISPMPLYVVKYYVKRTLYNVLVFFKLFPNRYKQQEE